MIISDIRYHPNHPYRDPNKKWVRVSKVNLRHHHDLQTNNDNNQTFPDFQHHNQHLHQDHVQVLSGESEAAFTEHFEDIAEALATANVNLKVEKSIITIFIIIMTTTMIIMIIIISPRKVI